MNPLIPKTMPPRKLHIVSRRVLENFLDDSGKLHVLRKDDVSKRIFKTTPKKAFRETDIYNIVNDIGEIDGHLEEDVYKRIEDLAVPILNKIIRTSGKGKCPSLSKKKRRLLDEYVYRQYDRAPHAFKRTLFPGEFEARAHRILGSFGQLPTISEEVKRLKSLSPAGVQRLKHQAENMARETTSLEIFEHFSSLGLVIGVAQSDALSFIVGDHSFAQLRSLPEATHPQTELWMPISSTVAICHFGLPGKESLINLDAAQVGKINKKIYKDSRMVAARSAEAILSALKTVG